MNGTWKLTVRGVRGSCPVPDAGFLEYGGNTSCLSLECADALMALDAGSGLAGLGRDMARRGLRRADILISHFHLDHLMGLFAFSPRYDPEAELHLYGMPGLAQALARLIAPPFWPVGLGEGKAGVYLHEIRADQPFALAGGAAPGVTVTALEGSHPGGCYYYRIEGAGRTLVYALDCELEQGASPRLADFARSADLLVWDAGFAPGELIGGWGHSTWEQGLALGRQAGVKQVLMSHYGLEHTDEFLRAQERLAPPPARFAREGMVIEL